MDQDKSYRQIFAAMGPRTHDRDPEKSEVIKIIKQKLECDTAKAVSVFNVLRHSKRRILIFDHVTRKWAGEAVVSPETQAREFRRDIRQLQKRAQMGAPNADVEKLSIALEALREDFEDLVAQLPSMMAGAVDNFIKAQDGAAVSAVAS